jgi:hypothetical protein
MATAQLAKALDGNQTYQVRARAALPMLVQLAHAGRDITYGKLAEPLGMKNPRTLNYPLGCIGQAIESLSKKWGESIPVIQCLVVNQGTGLPGEGVGWFVRDKGEFASLPLRKQRAIIRGIHAEVFAYPRWHDVLRALGLEPVRSDFSESLQAAANYRGGGESEQHKALKRYVATHPAIVGVPVRAAPGEQEFPIPSGDTIDVFFHHGGVRTAVEVKSRISPEADIVRGLFQCVKYRAVLEAQVNVDGAHDDIVNVVLALEGALPQRLEELRRVLGVAVVENIRVRRYRSNWNGDSA